MAAALRAELPNDDGGRRLLRTLLAVDADVQLRYQCMKAKCDELEHVLAFVARVRAARTKSREATQQRQEAVHAESRDVENSIGAAIRRARRIRLQMAGGGADANADAEADDGDVGDGGGVGGGRLKDILKQAKALSVTEQPTRDDRGEKAVVLTQQQWSPQAVRLEYPRRMKTLMEQLEDALANEKELSFRGAFCRKMTEHLSMREHAKADGGQEKEKGRMRVQVAYPVQVERLQLAYRRLGQYLDAKADPQSEVVQKALTTPSMSSVFPLYCRLKQARALMVQVDEAAVTLAHRIPPRPSLSKAGISHRDAMLERFRKKAPTLPEASAQASNRLFAMRHPISDISTHTTPLEKLQTAWEHAEKSSQSSRHERIKPYENAVDMAVLSEISTLVLSAFQNAFCSGEQSPPESTVRELMGVIRVAESAVVYKGRRQRSVVQR